MTTAIVIALVIYAAVALCLLFFVGLPILFVADCDHAFLLILPLAIVLPLIWPLVLVYFGSIRLWELTKGAMNLWRKLLCKIGSHRYFIIERLGPETCHVGCADCSREWGMHRGVHALLPWQEVADFHREAHGYRATTPIQHPGDRTVSDKYRIDLDFVVPEPTGANFFCTVSEEEFTNEFRANLIADWRAAGVKQMRTTLVNDEFPNPPYPHGVWVEGWTDDNARMLPFGEPRPDDGTISPPLVALDDPQKGPTHDHQ